MSTNSIDPDFLNLPLARLGDAALATAKGLGATHCDFRIVRNRTGYLALRNLSKESQVDELDLALGVRVIVDGAWGFASTPLLTSEAASNAAIRAVSLAKLAKPLVREEIILADEPIYSNQIWVSNYQIDPFEISDEEKLERLRELSRPLLNHHASITNSEASTMYVKEQKYYADSYGTSTTQQRIRIHSQLEAFATDESGFDSMRTLAQPTARGWEWMSNEATNWDWNSEVAQLPELLVQKRSSPSVTPGQYTLLLHPSNLWLTIHESIGHATELDRAQGYEANYAGSSFATPENLNRLQYGSPLLNVTGDRNAEHGLSSIAFDDEGVATGQWDLIKDGLLVGYQTDRRSATYLSQPRSSGSAFADSASHIPIQRMPNVSMAPAPAGPSIQEMISTIENGIYVLGDNSWSIDMQRYNFQFTGQQFHRIIDGEIVGQVKDVAYQSSTIDFWNSLSQVGGPETYVLGGAFNCGKAQPSQVAAVSHGCPAARFENINILNTAAGA